MPKKIPADVLYHTCHAALYEDPRSLHFDDRYLPRIVRAMVATYRGGMTHGAEPEVLVSVLLNFLEDGTGRGR